MNCFSSFSSHCSRARRADSDSDDIGAPALMTVSELIYALSVKVAIVDHPSSLELGPRQAAFRHQLEHRPDTESRLEPLAHRFLNLGFEVAVGDRQFSAHHELVHRLAPRDDDPKLAAKSGN